MQIKKWVLTVLLALVILASLGFVKFTQIQAAIAFGESFPEPSETVTTHTLSPTEWSETYRVAGRVVAPQQVTLTAETSGIIADVNFASNARVTQDDVFLTLNTDQEQAELAAVNAQIALAELDVERATRLLAQNATGQQQLDRAKAELKVAQAQAQAITARLAKKRIIIPFSGTLGLHALTPGQFIDVNTPLVELVNTERGLWVDVALPLAKQAWLSQPISVLTATQHFPAQVLSRNTSIDTITRNLPVRLGIASDDQLPPGSIVQVELTGPAQYTVYQVPNTALRYDALGSYVFALVQDDNGDIRATRHDVEVLNKNAQYTVIRTRLTAGAQIANIGAFKLRSNILVNVATGNAP